MAPFPEELDVFSIPHSRMKDLVEKYSTKMSGADFANSDSTASLLSTLHATFEVFMSHERIENEYIMHELKCRLRELQGTGGGGQPRGSQYEESALVCNCHSDNRLADMLQLVRDGRAGHGRSSLAERLAYGRKLRDALEDFTRTFLPHMREEEEVFQPMLLKYFEYDELRSLKDKVIEQHERLSTDFLLPDDANVDTEPEKFCLEVADLKPDIEWLPILAPVCRPVIKAEPEVFRPFDCMPPEVTLKILSYLWPPDLGRCSAVCRGWKSLARHPTLWHRLLPTNWAKGVWTNPEDEYFPDDDVFGGGGGDDDDGADQFAFSCPSPSGCSGCLRRGPSCRQSRLPRDEDADVDESYDSEEEDSSSCAGADVESCDETDGLECHSATWRVERRTLEAIAEHLLPHVGSTVHFLSLAGSRCVEAKWLTLFLSECPHLRSLNLSYTNLNQDILESVRSNLVSARGGLARMDEGTSKPTSRLGLRHLDLNGCQGLNDDGLMVLFECLRLAGSSTFRLEFLSLSGCSRLTDDCLRFLLSVSGPLSRLTYLDLSGCSQLSGEALAQLVAACPRLRPEQLFYCDNVIDGPYQQTANGCQNRGNQFRTCCCIE